jgi:hypothetical protein
MTTQNTYQYDDATFVLLKMRPKAADYLHVTPPLPPTMACRALL